MAKPSIKIHKKGQTQHIILGLQHRHEGGFHHSNVPAADFQGCWDAEDLIFFRKVPETSGRIWRKQVMLLVIYIIDISGITHQIITVIWNSILLNIP